VTEIQEKLNAFADTVEQIFTMNSDADRSFIAGTERVVNDFLKQPLIEWMRATSRSEIAWVYRHLNPRKAPGLTGYRI
jgi:hypothetical protein